jgi:aspartyl/asparaginyl beta-hydroxylase (cupin superfamily)
MSLLLKVLQGYERLAFWHQVYEHSAARKCIRKVTTLACSLESTAILPSTGMLFSPVWVLGAFLVGI